MIIRDRVAKNFNGGPPFKIRADKMIVEVGNGDVSSTIAAKLDQGLDAATNIPLDSNALARVQAELSRLGFRVERLDNAGVLVLKAEVMDTIIDNITNAANTFSKQVKRDLSRVREKAANTKSKTFVGGWTPGNLNFFSFGDTNFTKSEAAIEASLRNHLSDLSLKNPLTNAISEIENVANVELSFTPTTFGPRNLNVNTDKLESVMNSIMGDEDAQLPGMEKALDKFGVPKAWEISTGENSVIAIFDTSFYDEFLESDRVIDTFSGDEVDSAYSDPEEGHGTMCAVAAAGNKNDGAPVDGVAKDAELLLARVTNSEGGMSLVEEAWDWLIGHIKNLDKPVLSNHSYGVPMCNGAGMGACESSTTKMIAAACDRDDHQAFYAAGNEALYCGHRLVGATNGIMGVNSHPNVITVGANRFDLRDAQPYSSHGFGRCSSLKTNPKPDVSCLLPSYIPYGTDVKDMSSGRGGSNGGTSLASPLTCGVGALIASKSDSARQEDIEDVLEKTAKLPRPTQINAVIGHDARFGKGQVYADKALNLVQERMANASSE